MPDSTDARRKTRRFLGSVHDKVPAPGLAETVGRPGSDDGECPDPGWIRYAFLDPNANGTYNGVGQLKAVLADSVATGGDECVIAALDPMALKQGTGLQF